MVDGEIGYAGKKTLLEDGSAIGLLLSMYSSSLYSTLPSSPLLFSSFSPSLSLSFFVSNASAVKRIEFCLATRFPFPRGHQRRRRKSKR